MSISRVCLAVTALAFSLLSTSAAFAEPATCSKGAKLEVEWGGTWYSATALEGPNANKECKIHYDGYDASWDEWVAPARTRAGSDANLCKKGDKLLVEWKQGWYPAAIIDGPDDKKQCKVHYDGYDDSWNEFVTAERMRRKMATASVKLWCVKGNKIMVEWKQKFYAATVLEGPNDKQQCKIHYDGWDANWDEFIGSDRVF
jgi:hypothetical protein